MNDILIAIRRGGRALMIGETPKGKRWIQDNQVAVDGVVWITHEAIEDVIEAIKADGLHVEAVH